MEINERIFQLLDSKGLKAKDLGEYINVKPSSISAWKNEGSYPSSKYVFRISEFLGVTLDFLLTGNENTDNLSTLDINLLSKYKMLTDKDKKEVYKIIEMKLEEDVFTNQNQKLKSSSSQNGKKNIKNKTGIV